MSDESAKPIWAVIYDTTTGRIRQAVQAAEAELPLWLQDGEAWLPAPGPTGVSRAYVLAGVLTNRPELAVSKINIRANGVDAAVIKGLPVPCVVEIDGDSVTIDDGEIELTSVESHTWSISIPDPFPYRRFKTVITATAP